MKKLAIYGATGATGELLVGQALESGYEIYAHSRNEKNLNWNQENLHFVKGNVLNEEEVRNNFVPVDAVFIVLGAGPMERKPIRSEGTQNILRAMKTNGVQRVIVMTTLGMGNTYDMLSTQMKEVVVPSFLKHAFEDHRIQEQEVESSDTDWTILRPANLKDGKWTGQYQMSTEPSTDIEGNINRSDVADALLHLYNDENSILKKYWVSY